MIIGLAGYARVGKSTIARAVAELTDAQVASFAGELKRRVDALFLPDTPKELKRDTYVAYGKAMRAIDPMYWVEALAENMPAHANVIIDDVRYSNEINWIRNMGGVVIRIDRPGIGPANDEEATSFAAMPKLPLLRNDDTIETAVRQVLALLREHRLDAA
jgi:hypothetical protein